MIPADAVGSVLITSRDRKIIGSVANSGFPLNAMNELDAKYLFLRLSSSSAESISDTEQTIEGTQVLHDLLQELQYFPLAIDQAASFIRENSPMTAKEYLDYLKPRSLDRERLLRFKQARPDYPESVMTTWEISLDFLYKVNPRASWILQFLGFLDNSSISEDLLLSTLSARLCTIKHDYKFEFGICQLPESAQIKLANLRSDVGFREAIGRLTSLSLIQRNATTRNLSVHPLVHEWIRVRLNTRPKVQADWTVTAVLVLFQTFPSDMFLNPSSFWEITYYGHNNFLLVKGHIGTLLENLQGYMQNLDELPIECYILCETLLLAAFFDDNDGDAISFLPSQRTPKNPDSIIQSVLTRLSPEYVPIASIIHRLVMWVRKKGPRRGSNRTKDEMASALENLHITCPLENSNILFLMLLAQAVVKVSSCTDDVHSKPFSFAARQADITKEHEVEETRKQKLNSRLFSALQGLLELAKKSQKPPLLYEITHFLIKGRLLNCITPKDFVRIDCLHPSYMLSTDLIAHLSYSETGQHLCRLAQLLWGCDSPRDYEGIKLLFSVAYRYWKVLLVKEHGRAVQEQTERSIKYQTSSRYISSSFGRSVEPLTEDAKDLESPLSYLWKISHEVAIGIANPDTRWTTRQCLKMQPKPFTSSLDKAERRSAEDLFLRMQHLYSKIIALGHCSLATQAALEPQAFMPDEVKYTLIQIYLLTGQWHKAQRVLVVWLQLSSVTEFCKTVFRYEDRQTGTFPWSISTNPDPPPSPGVEQQPSYIYNSFSSKRAQQDGIRHLQIGTLDIPESCDCIANSRADDMIEAFLSLEANQPRLPAEKRLELGRNLQYLRRNLSEDERRLGRLQIIYGLAQGYLKELTPQDFTMKTTKERDIVSRHRHFDELVDSVATETSSNPLYRSSFHHDDKILDDSAVSSEKEQELDFEW